MNIEEIDENFKVKFEVKEGTKIYNPKEEPFEINGLLEFEDCFCRIPPEVAKKTSDGVANLNKCTAGGRIRFKTNSTYINIYVKYPFQTNFMPHFSIYGSNGLDLYAKIDGKEFYINSFGVSTEITSEFNSSIDGLSGEMLEYTINLPLYNGIAEIYIGLMKNAKLEKPSPYKNTLPVVYYGSSITQGGCASRAGNSYEAILSRKYNIDYVNLGFSGNAKGEDEICDYVSKLKMSMFVLDYDHNSPDAEHLKNTHEKFLKKVRKENPSLPILILSAPIFDKNDYWRKREKIIEETYNNAINSGDKNVYYLSGKELMAHCLYDGTVDNCHPNDFGFFSIANAISKVFDKIFI